MGLISTLRRAFGRKPNPKRAADVRGTYDAARESDQFSRYWANADHFDADSANSREVRRTLISRSRYESANNPYAAGILATYCDDLIGTGPQLRMMTLNPNFNELVETNWRLWTAAIRWRRKLWTMAHAKVQDGETFAVIRLNRNVANPVPLDVVVYEAEQVSTPYLPYGTPGAVDGIRFDRYGVPVEYDLLLEHPGAISQTTFGTETETIPADRMLHWFKQTRPGQHRQVPENSSSLNTGAAARRWREATLAAAETAADFSVLLKTNLDTYAEAAEAFSAMPIDKRMMVALPEMYEAQQLKAEHPTAQYDAFHKTLINEQARPLSMPYNKAACDSSSYNFASGRLDHQTYYRALDIDRADADDQANTKLFLVWFDFAIQVFGWLGGDPLAIGPAARLHTWRWPRHSAADEHRQAQANALRLSTGQLSLPQLYSEQGLEYEEEIAGMATAYGVSIDEMRRRLLDNTLPPGPSSEPPPAVEAAAELRRRAALMNGSANHA